MNEILTIEEMIRKGVRLKDLTPDQLLEVSKDRTVSAGIWTAIEREIIWRLECGADNA